MRKLQPAASIFDHVRTTSLPVHGSLVSIWPLLPAAIDVGDLLELRVVLGSASWARLTLPMFFLSGLASSTPLLETANA